MGIVGWKNVQGILVDLRTDEHSSFYLHNLELFFYCLCFWVLFRFLVRRLFAIPLSARVLGAPNRLRELRSAMKALGQRLPPSFVLHKEFQLHCWKAVSHIFLSTYLFWALSKELDWLLYYQDSFGEIINVPWRISLYYNLNIAYYCYDLVVLLFIEHRAKDFKQALIHHILTLFLAIGSYYWVFRIHIGTLIMALHNMADPFLPVAKIFKYSSVDLGANITFALFAFAFIVSRCIIYPGLCVLPAIWYVLEASLSALISLSFISVMLMLLTLDIYWAVLIVKLILKILATGSIEQEAIRTSEIIAEGTN